MAVKIEIVIPSMGRADRVITKDCIKNAILCVPESEKQAYEEHNPGMPILTHPDSLKGLARKRQFIYEHFPNSFQIDDDIRHIQRIYTESGEKTALDAEKPTTSCSSVAIWRSWQGAISLVSIKTRILLAIMK